MKKSTTIIVWCFRRLITVHVFTILLKFRSAAAVQGFEMFSPRDKPLTILITGLLTLYILYVYIFVWVAVVCTGGVAVFVVIRCILAPLAPTISRLFVKGPKDGKSHKVVREGTTISVLFSTKAH
jgi:hypothetical protein